MTRFIKGLGREQMSLLPACVDDYVDVQSPVRAIDAFVDMLDLAVLGFYTEPEATGRPGYHPATMLKIYLYGYLNQVQSSRRLERECARNLELIGLAGQLKPDFKTIADFRKDNGPAIRKVSRQLISLCRDIDLLDASIVAIDGSKFKAVNAKAKSFTREKLRRRLGEIDASIDRYMAELDRVDEVVAKTGMMMPEAGMARAMKKLAHYKKEADTLRAVERRMEATGETQVSLTDPDCRAMATTSKQPRVVGYNVQSVVETRHHLIVAHEVTNLGYDREALSMMTRAAQEVMATESIEAIAGPKGEPRRRMPRASAPASDVIEVAVSALAAGEACGPCDALGLHDGRACRPFALQALAHRLAPGAIGRKAIRAHAFLGKACDLLGHRLGRLAGLAVRYHLLGEANSIAFLSRYLAPRHDDFERPTHADQARQAHSAAIDQRHAPAPAIDAEVCALGQHTHVAPHRELHAACYRRALDSGDHRLGQL